ncbi:MAG: translation initiation inhibitor, partial [Phycisphaeraceae bacterium JB051]
MHVESENNPVSCEASHAARIAYHRFEPEGVPVDVCYSQFTGASGVSEYELCLTPLDHGPTSQQLSWLEAAYHQAIDALGLKLDTGICRRFFCSDPHNQQPDLRAFAFSNPQHNDPPCAVSWTGQPPVPPAKVSMWAQHVFDPSGLNIQCDDHSLTLDRGALAHHWSTNLIGIRKHSSFDQTQCIFDDYEAFLDKHQMNLADHVMRTWFYVRHVDVNYKGLVVARRELFEKRGLTADTHYIASTGIEGNPPHDRAKVAMDAYAVGGIQPQQVKYVEALDHLGPTHAYGVTFERATALSFADRQHIY